MKKKFAIVGGGVAGLSAAIRLAELGEEPLVLEGGTYPAHKVCGEFLSPECVDQLQRWGVEPIAISKLTLKTTASQVEFTFPRSAGGLSHIELDPALANYASRLGSEVKINTRVKTFQAKKNSTDRHLLELSDGEMLEADIVLFATGRIPSYSLSPPISAYMGFKAHFSDIPSFENLAMFSLPGAYLGIAPIESQKCNVACLAKMNLVKGSPQNFIESLISQNPFIQIYFSYAKNLFNQWMVTTLPDFGVKKTPHWLDAYFIGDAAVTIPPACGSGLSMAILGGKLAAEFAVRRQAEEFKKIWSKSCHLQVFWGKLLHHLLLNPSAGAKVGKLIQHFPYLTKKLYQLTRTRI